MAAAPACEPADVLLPEGPTDSPQEPAGPVRWKHAGLHLGRREPD
jgi:hypothetical protein